MNSAIVRASRSSKHAFVSADLQKRGLDKRVDTTDDDLLRRWERIAKEVGRD